jgi:type IX secretion system PorP/SprF family membrane protein
MGNVRKCLLVIFLIAMLSKSSAQDFQFTQFYAAPLYLNPAFAGATLQSRATFNSRYQWAGLPKPFISYAASLDHNFDKYNSGVGIISTYDKSGSGALKNVNLGVQYAYLVRVTSIWSLRTGLQLSYVSRSLDYDKLTFGDQIDQTGVAASSNTHNLLSGGVKTGYADFSAGSLLHNDRIWIGVTVNHMNTPNQSLTDSKTPLPMKTTIHGGYKFDLSYNIHTKSYGEHKDKSISPAFLYKSQGKFDQLDLGCYLHFEPMVFGLWYRGIPVFKSYKRGYGNTDAFAFLLGFKKDHLSIGYSYDITFSKLNEYNTAGSHEISIGITFDTSQKNKKPKVKRRDMVIPCPRY